MILHMLRIHSTQVYHDPLRAGINDVQELSKTHEAIANAKTEIQHRILTHYLPLYFPEIERFRGNSRSDWVLRVPRCLPHTIEHHDTDEGEVRRSGMGCCRQESEQGTDFNGYL